MSKIKELIPYVVIVVVVVLIRTFIVTPVVVSGDSMVPSLKDGQLLLLNKLSYKFKEIERFDVVVIKVGKNEIIKRVIGLPGETVEYKNNNLYINGELIETEYDFETDDFEEKLIPEDKYFVLGDNRRVSSDSRIIGMIKREDIIGKTNISILPVKLVK